MLSAKGKLLWQPAHVIHENALEELLDRLSSLRRHQQNGKRAPHKPLLVLLALGRLAETGSSAVPWSVAEKCLGELIAEFGPPSLTARRQSAAYPFTRLRSDGVWTLDRDVPMDSLGALDSSPITGRLDPRLEQMLKEPGAIEAAARVIVDSQFPMTVAPDVLLAVGLDPTRVFAAPAPGTREDRRRSSAWPAQILSAWDNQCAFCGYDGHLGSSPVGLEAAHVRWFNLDGPDDLDNGLALYSLHHKLLDRGALGLDDEHRVVVSDRFTARTESARRVYELHHRQLRPRRGTLLPAQQHTAWHQHQVFQGQPLTG